MLLSANEKPATLLEYYMHILYIQTSGLRRFQKIIQKRMERMTRMLIAVLVLLPI